MIGAAIIIANNFSGTSILTYPSIFICYLAVVSFNEANKSKILFVFVLAFTLIYGLIVLPAIYNSLADDRKMAFYYVFPLLIFILRTINGICYWFINKTAVLFIQLPLFITGLQYGIILTLDAS